MDCENLLLAHFVATKSGGQLILKNKLEKHGDAMASHLKLSITHSLVRFPQLPYSPLLIGSYKNTFLHDKIKDLDPYIHTVARF